MGKLFTLLVFLLLTYQLDAQSTYMLNGRLITELNGKCFSVTNGDTTFINTSAITIKYKEGQLEGVRTNVEQLFGLASKGNLLNKYYVYNLSTSLPFAQVINALNSRPEIEKTYLSIIGRAFADKPTPNDPIPTYPTWPIALDGAWWLGGSTQGISPELEYLNIPGVWGEYTTGNPNVIVAVLDDGIDWSIQDFPANNQLGWNFVFNNSNTNPYYTYNNPYHIQSSHGTKVTSVLCSRTNNSSGVYGIAGGWQGENQGITPMSVVVGTGYNGYVPSSGYNLDLMPLAIIWACEHGARIINMSLGFDGILPEEKIPTIEAIDYAIKKYNTIFVASSGNYGPDGWLSPDVSFPANYEPVIAVGGTDINHKRYYFGPAWSSSYGPELDFVTSFMSFYNQGNLPISGPDFALGWDVGTSFSAPMLSGVIGLMLSVYPCLSTDEIIEALKYSCYKNPYYTFNNGHNNEVGYGFPNAKVALDYLASKYDPVTNITQNTTWNTPKYISSNVTIKAGATLTVTSKIKFAEQVRLFVEKGAHLIIDGGILSSLCTNWDGVVAYGDPTLPQYPESNQAKVTIINKGIIENAMCGIRACIPTDGKAGFENSGGGAIVWAENALFKNCFISASFAPYNYNNSGRFILSSFIVDDQLPASGFSTFVKLNEIPNIQFKGCEFTISNSDGNIYQTGNGITSFNSGYTVDGMCRDNADNNCPPEFFVRSKFTGLNYGSYSENIGDSKTITIKNSDYTYTKHGIYASVVNGLLIKGNTFDVVPSNEMYGVYLNNCNKYLVEGNTFDKTSSASAKCIGLYINNSGGENNYVYNNIFKNLNHAAVADGINRNNALQTGLCFKCNDFINCSFDLIMPYPVVPPFSVNHGVRAYQGTPGSLNTDAAGNTFSTNAVYNIYNELHPIVYVHHETKNPPYAKIIPAPRTTNTVALYNNTLTTYTKSLSCPPSMLGDTKEAMRAEIAAAHTGIQNTETQLAAFTDGGNTTEMSLDVQSAQSYAALTLYEELIATSPYLSDTVMKLGIENIGALPDAMLRDVLVANPQSAKSGDVMKALDERAIPIPDEMKEEVKEGLNNFASYDMMLGNLAMWKDNLSIAQAGLAQLYATDSLYSRSLDSLAAMYTATHTLEAKYNLALLQLNRGNIVQAQQLLVSLPTVFNMSNLQMAIHEDYINIANRIAVLQQNTNTILAADSSALMQQLSAMATADNNLPDAIARNILHASGYITYSEPIQMVDPVKAASANDAKINQSNGQASSLSSLQVYPNPASDYCIVRYHTAAKGNYMLQITSLQGQSLESIKIKNESNSKVIPLKNYKPGTYIVSLYHQNKVLESLQLIVK